VPNKAMEYLSVISSSSSRRRRRRRSRLAIIN